jgi:hypothetical protein
MIFADITKYCLFRGETTANKQHNIVLDEGRNKKNKEVA